MALLTPAERYEADERFQALVDRLERALREGQPPWEQRDAVQYARERWERQCREAGEDE